MAVAYKGDGKKKRKQPKQFKKAQEAKKETIAVVKEKEDGKVEIIEKSEVVKEIDKIEVEEKAKETAKAEKKATKAKSKEKEGKKDKSF